MPPAGEAAHRLSGRQQIDYAPKKAAGAPPIRRAPAILIAPRRYFGVLGLVVEELLLELLFDVPLGFMLPLLLPVPGDFEVSVVDPVVGAAGRA